MPRGHRGRGGGSGRGRGRGGFSGGGGRGGGKNKKKFSRGRGRGGSRGGHYGQDSRNYSELDDLENADFVSVNAPQNSMRASAARSSKNRRMRLQDEVFETENNVENTMKLPLRQRPVEFVKAELYDPTRDLIQRLSEKQNNCIKSEKDEAIQTEEKIPGPSSVEPASQSEEVDLAFKKISTISEDPILITEGLPSVSEEIAAEIRADLDDIVFSSDDEPEHGIEDKEDHKPLFDTQPSPKKPKIEKVPDNQLFFVDEEGVNDPEPVRKVFVDPPKPKAKPLPGTNLEYDPSFTVGHVLLTTTRNSKGDVFTSLAKNTKKVNNLNSFNADSSVYELADEDEDIYQNNSQNLYKSYDEYLRNVMDNLHTDDDDDDDGEGIYDEIDEDFEEEAKFIASAEGNDGFDYDSIDLDDDERISLATDNVGNLTIDSDNELKGKDKEPEYGFLPEDYESFDNNLVETIQIRYGASSNKYFLKSFKMTGTYDYQWVDQENLEDFLLENGMPDHRLYAYFKFIEKQVTPDELDEAKFDLPISDSSDEEEEDYGRGKIIYDDDEDDYDDEGLEDLIQFTQKYDGLRDMEVDPTHTLQSRGKKKKELILDNIADEDLRKSLQAQFDVRYENKREKKRRWDKNVAKEHEKSSDLSLKYPYALHIKEIRGEFDSFFQDKKRNSLAFPPMDPHGIKTIQKIAYLYNMLARKFGAGKKVHVVVIKNKRTFRCQPDYHSVGQLMRQRPIFNRTDQKRPRTEIEYEEGKSSRRGKPSKAYVREGEVVGADAPEIASNNVGRLLLMKMGWSSGQGLGADNRGVPEPIIAKVKNTKSGIR